MKFDEKLNQLNIENVYPFHMPGHKRSETAKEMFMYNPYSIDITEIDGYDNLHNPEGMILEAQQRISRMCKAADSFILVNGSTSGILAAISAVTNYGDRILMARNSHKSAYNAVCIRGLETEYVYPEAIKILDINGAITVESMKKAYSAGVSEEIKNAHIYSADASESTYNGARKGMGYRAVYITSPTYEGVVSNIREIADFVHEQGAVLIVDEAHGAHFGLSEYFPKSAVTEGADIVIQSIHKTLPGMTQTAVLHVSEDGKKRIDVEKLKYYLRTYQTSSPSYVLMASVDNCYRFLEASENHNLWGDYRKRIEYFLSRCEAFKDIKIFTPDKLQSVDKGNIIDFDCGKIVIYSKSGAYHGKEIYNMLREEYGLQLEMSLGRYALAMTSCMDTDEALDRLFRALSQIDARANAKASRKGDTGEANRGAADINGDASETNRGAADINGDAGETKTGATECIGQVRNQAKCTIAQAFEAPKKEVAIEEGQICGEYCYVYPPGIPLVVPGEIISKEIIESIRWYQQIGYEVHGVKNINGDIRIKTLC